MTAAHVASMASVFLFPCYECIRLSKYCPSGWEYTRNTLDDSDILLSLGNKLPASGEESSMTLWPSDPAKFLWIFFSSGLPSHLFQPTRLLRSKVSLTIMNTPNLAAVAGNLGRADVVPLEKYPTIVFVVTEGAAAIGYLSLLVHFSLSKVLKFA
jgi:hypothetical protein